MPPTCTRTISHHPNVIARFVTLAAKKVAGVKVPKIAKSSARPTARHNALKEDASDPSLEIVAIW